jgi:hypothetical protein
MTEHASHLPVHRLFQFLECLEGFLVPTLCNYDDLPSQILKTLLYHRIFVSEGNFHHLPNLTKNIFGNLETAGFVVRL